MSVNCQVSADNGFSTDENTEYLEKHGLGGYISSQKLSRKEKKEKYFRKTIFQDNFNYGCEMMAYMCPLDQSLYKKRISLQKQNKNHALD